jgi:hypothetical protein
MAWWPWLVDKVETALPFIEAVWMYFCEASSNLSTYALACKALIVAIDV